MDEHMMRHVKDNWDREQFEEETGIWPTTAPNLTLKETNRKAHVYYCKERVQVLFE
jgi:hypothetical protein